MDNLKKFAEEIFRGYNSEGSRRADNIELVSQSQGELVYHYTYTGLDGTSRRLSKKFKYDKEGKPSHEGPLEVK